MLSVKAFTTSFEAPLGNGKIVFVSVLSKHFTSIRYVHIKREKRFINNKGMYFALI